MAEKYGIKTVGAGYAKCITKNGVTMSHEEILQELRDKDALIQALQEAETTAYDRGYVEGREGQ